MNIDRAKTWIRGAASVAVAVLLASAPAVAQEGEASPVDSTLGWVMKWLNFAIVFGAIAYFVVKTGGPAFRARAEKIAGAIGEAARAREAAEQQRRDVQQKMVNLANEVADMRTAAKHDADAEAARLREMAKSEAEKIEKIAQAEIAASERAARMELKGIGARLAVEHAKAMLKREMTPHHETQLFKAFVDELERGAN